MKRKEFLASLGLLGIAPKLLSKEATVAENATVGKNVIFNIKKLTVETLQVGGVENIKKYDIAHIITPDPTNKMAFVTAANCIVLDCLIKLGGVAEIDLLFIKEANELDISKPLILAMQTNYSYPYKKYGINLISYEKDNQVIPLK